jgi:hypothetical protein
MNDPFLTFLSGLQSFWEESWFIATLRFFAMVYVLVLLVDIILLVWMTDIKSSVRENLTGAKRPAGSRNKYIRRWEGILSRLEGENPAQYKVAILEADVFAEEILEILGYTGEHMQDRLARMADYDVEAKNDLVFGHAVRNRVIQEPDFNLTREEAEGILRRYGNFFKEADLF